MITYVSLSISLSLYMYIYIYIYICIHDEQAPADPVPGRGPAHRRRLQPPPEDLLGALQDAVVLRGPG